MEDLSRFFETKWMTPHQRSLATFETFLKGDFSERFLSENFIKELLAERKRQTEKFQRAFGLSLLIAVALVFVDRLTTLSFEYQGVKIGELRSFEPLFVIFMSLFFMTAIFAAMDMFICNQMISKIFHSAGIFNPALYHVNNSADDIWLDGLTPRFFGPVSGMAHKGTFVFIGSAMLLIIALMVCDTGDGGAAEGRGSVQ